MCFGLGLSAEGLAGVVEFLGVEEDEAAAGELAAEEAGQFLEGAVVGDGAGTGADYGQEAVVVEFGGEGGQVAVGLSSSSSEAREVRLP